LDKAFTDKIAEKLWPGISAGEKKQLFQLLVVTAIVMTGAIANVVLSLFDSLGNSNILGNLGVVIVVLLAFVFIINGKIKSALYTIFSIPFFIYAYYISDFSQHPPMEETVFSSVWWLIGGALLLLLFTETDFILLFYYGLSLFTVGLQLHEANRLFSSFSSYNPFVTHPLLILSAFFGVFYFIRIKYRTRVEALAGQLKTTSQRLNKVVQESAFAVAQIRAERDEDENIVNLWIEKINNTFESTFKIKLHEAQNQEAGYIFNLLFNNHFDVNKALFLSSQKSMEFHAENIEKWFRVNVLRPDFNLFFLIFEDITKIKQRIAQLEVSKRRYKVLLEAIPDIFFVIDKDGVYEDFVIKESDLLKIDDVNIIGNNIYNVGFPDNMADKIYACIQNCLKFNTIETIEYSLNTHNGTFMFEMRLARLNPHSVISVARDITKRKTAEFNLEKALKKAQESDRLKSAFLANLSHEIRTPLNIITNFTRMLAEIEVGLDEKMELSDAITQNGQQLMNMIDNTIHLSKIETGTVDVNMDFCKINTLLRDIYNRYMTQIPDTKPVKIRMNMDVPNPVFGFITDAQLLREALSILIDNAIKYTLKGEVVFGYEMIRNEAVKFEVSDSGIGIPPEETENIFSRFYRVKNKVNETTSGSGIGLPIAQHYIKIMGGELEMESKPGVGSKFWFVLPFNEGQGYLRVVS
jgi:PAS domain S-box-containing protein